MTQLLIHSMAEFAETILGCLTLAEARTVVEIGAEYGGMSQRLGDHLAPIGGELISIDPAPDRTFLAWAAARPHVRHLPQPSLEAMPTLAGIDAWVIDGDHNYYTVLHELRLADRLGRRDGKPLLAILHDVAWPCARRDMYYAPDRIPADWRHPYSYDDGVPLEGDALVRGGGFRGMGRFGIATHAGGERNGVLTAVEDFVAGTPGLAFAFVPAVFGLGVVFDSAAPWAAEVATLLHPLHDNPLIARLEENRLRNYLAVLAWQDRAAAVISPALAA